MHLRERRERLFSLFLSLQKAVDSHTIPLPPEFSRISRRIDFIFLSNHPQVQAFRRKLRNLEIFSTLFPLWNIVIPSDQLLYSNITLAIADRFSSNVWYKILFQYRKEWVNRISINLSFKVSRSELILLINHFCITFVTFLFLQHIWNIFPNTLNNPS